MPDLEAFTDYKPSDDDLKRNPTLSPQQFGWRYPIPVGRPVRLGRNAADAEWTVLDDMVSGLHVVLSWTGQKLLVTRADKVPPHPKKPRNPIWFQNKDTEEFEVGVGEWFVIGRTTFAVRPDREADRPAPVDETMVQLKREATRDQLERVAFSNPAAALKAMERLPAYIKAATNEQGLFRPMLRVVLEALPQADAAAVVRVPPDDDAAKSRLVVAEQHVRFPRAFGPSGFVPSKALYRRAITERKSCLHIWSNDFVPGSPSADAQATMAFLQSQNSVPWAICTPFQDGSKHALYATGRVTVKGKWSALDTPTQESILADLTGYQRIVELLTGMTEATVRMCRLTRQTHLTRQAWPQAVRKHLDDPDRLEEMLKPQEKDVTVLFCDLRNYSQFASDNAGKLVEAWKEIAYALDTMSSTVTLRNGVVAGFRGDAILGFWGWPNFDAAQVKDAALAATIIRQRLSGWLQGKKCGLGLTHGRAVAGRLGAHDLAVVDLYGPVVNLAFRLEAMTKAFGVNIIVSQAVADGVAAADPDGNELRTRRLGTVKAKGFTHGIPAFELFAAHGTAWDEWQRPEWDHALEFFDHGDWADAYDRLDSLFSTDPAAQCLMRVMDRTQRVPPTRWDGAFVPVPPPGD
jgi:adenylate cyclase